MLNGLKIVEMSTYVAGPAAACLMSDLGADVIKVEPMGGDPIRHFFSTVAAANLEGNPIFDMDNRGKRSIMVDLAQGDGPAVVKALLRDADVFVTNIRPQSLARAGLDYDSLKGAFPKLIYAGITGYGRQGPEKDRPGFDMAAFWARSGLASLTKPKGHEPIPMRVGVGDHVTGVTLAAGILAAIYERGRTGKGRRIDVSLLATGIYCLGSDLSIQLRFGKVGSTRARKESPTPTNSFYQCGDGRWVCFLSRHSGDDWQRMLRALERTDLCDDPRFLSGKLRRQNAAELTEELDRIFATRPLTEWAERLDAFDIIWAPVQTPAEVVADAQAEAAGAFAMMPDGQGGMLRTVALPIGTDGERPSLGASPRPGQHTDEILSEAGFDSDRIATLKTSGAIG